MLNGEAIDVMSIARTYGELFTAEGVSMGLRTSRKTVHFVSPLTTRAA